MKELRAPLADRVALTLINRRQIKGQDLSRQDTGVVPLSDSGRKTALQAWRGRKRVGLRHAFMDEPVSLGLAAPLQAQLLARHLRG